MDNFYGKKLNSLQALRAIAALMIIFEHVRFLQCGVFAVDIFFVLSGFMIIYSTNKGMEHFLMKRIIRIVPFYWLVTLLTFIAIKLVPTAFASTLGGVKELLLSLFFIPFDMNNGYVFTLESLDCVIQPLMRIGWTLNLEMLFYVLFFVAAKINYKFRALITAGFMIILNIVSSFVFAPILVLWGNPITLEFTFGMGLCYLCKYLSHKKISKALSSLSGMASVLLVFVLALLRHENLLSDANRVILWGVTGSLIVLLTYLYGENYEAPKALVWAGDMSFSIYYVHYYIVQLADRYVFDFSTPSVLGFLGLALCIILTLLISRLTYLLIEKKLTGLLKKKLVS